MHTPRKAGHLNLVMLNIAWGWFLGNGALDLADDGSAEAHLDLPLTQQRHVIQALADADRARARSQPKLAGGAAAAGVTRPEAVHQHQLRLLARCLQGFVSSRVSEHRDINSLPCH